MESHRTSDGRAATPTVILLDASYAEAGCWIERPAVLQQWFDSSKEALAEAELYRQKYEWYDRDAGQETVREMIELLEAAAEGMPRCTAPEAGAEARILVRIGRTRSVHDRCRS